MKNKFYNIIKQIGKAVKNNLEKILLTGILSLSACEIETPYTFQGKVGEDSVKVKSLGIKGWGVGSHHFYFFKNGKEIHLTDLNSDWKYESLKISGFPSPEKYSIEDTLFSAKVIRPYQERADSIRKQIPKIKIQEGLKYLN